MLCWEKTSALGRSTDVGRARCINRRPCSLKSSPHGGPLFGAIRPERERHGHEVLRGSGLKTKKLAIQGALGCEADFATKTTVLRGFDFRAFLNLAMRMKESLRAGMVRQLVLDRVIDTINARDFRWR